MPAEKFYTNFTRLPWYAWEEHLDPNDGVLNQATLGTINGIRFVNITDVAGDTIFWSFPLNTAVIAGANLEFTVWFSGSGAASASATFVAFGSNLIAGDNASTKPGFGTLSFAVTPNATSHVVGVSTQTFISGTHFPSNLSSGDIFRFGLGRNVADTYTGTLRVYRVRVRQPIAGFPDFP